MKRQSIGRNLLMYGAIAALVWFFTPNTGEENRKRFGDFISQASTKAQKGANSVLSKSAQATNAIITRTGEMVEQGIHGTANALHSAADTAQNVRTGTQQKIDNTQKQAEQNSINSNDTQNKKNMRTQSGDNNS